MGWAGTPGVPVRGSTVSEPRLLRQLPPQLRSSLTAAAAVGAADAVPVAAAEAAVFLAADDAAAAAVIVPAAYELQPDVAGIAFFYILGLLVSGK